MQKTNSMKTKAFLFLLLSLGFINGSTAQLIIKSDKAVFTISGTANFIVTKTEAGSKKVLFRAETKIPDKSKQQMYFELANEATFNLIGDNIVMVYDVWQKGANTKDCYVKLLSTTTGKFEEPKLLYSTKMNSMYSSNEVIYKSIYSPDKTKLAVLKDNISPTYAIEPELTIYDTSSFAVLSTKVLSGKYEGQKSVFDLSNTTMDDNGNINTVFHLMNVKTKMTTKSFTADIPLNETGLKNIKELDANTSADGDKDSNSHGHFYKTLDDYINDKPIPDVRIKNGSFSWTVFSGVDYKLIDDAGNLKKESSKTLPAEIFTYKRHDSSNPFVMRLIDKKPYIVLAAGKLNHYSLYLEQDKRFISEGWDGKLKKFKEGDFEDYLEKYNLLKDYKKDKPKREFKDNVNDYFNKVVNWQVKYFNLVNKVM